MKKTDDIGVCLIDVINYLPKIEVQSKQDLAEFLRKEINNEPVGLPFTSKEFEKWGDKVIKRIKEEKRVCKYCGRPAEKKWQITLSLKDYGKDDVKEFRHQYCA